MGCHKAGAVTCRPLIILATCSILGCIQQHGKLSHLPKSCRCCLLAHAQ